VIAPARSVAFQVVRRVFEDDAYTDRILDAAAADLDARDRALAQRIAYGTVQRRRTLDYGIDTLGRRPTRKLDPAVLAALRIAAYELGWSEAPAHAVADDAVELVRSANLERATGFTNAVCRRLAEGFRRLVAELPEGPLKHSYPDWIHDVWVRDFGEEEALALERAQNEPPPLEEYRGMSRASRLAAEVVQARPGERVLDACAAPGNKTSLLQGDVTAVEINPARASRLAERLPNVRVVNADVRELDERGFDRALVDAPCSGLGVLNRRPDLRWRSKPLPELQRGLLAAAAERTRPGGTIVYAVCTLNADENEAIVDASGLEPEPLGEEHPEYAHPKRPEFLLTSPHRHATSGFFIARLRR
jgi:16S rRNA (cytosine967-C5)-methyltransferase